MTSVLDRRMMARALVLAERGRPTCRPNPAVGCVVARGETVVGEGWHAVAGGPHAEVAALAAAGRHAAGATAYVTLEPCDHVGRTGPCTAALLAAGVHRVVYALADPLHGGARTLAAAGVGVEVGPLGEWAAVQNEAFLHAAGTGRPFVTLKLAQTPEGSLVVPGRRWLTGEEARRAVHRQRSRHDAVLVGSQTVLDDDPRLDVRDVPARGGQPRPVVVDARGRTPVGAAVVARRGLVFTTSTSDHGWRAALAERGAEVVVVAPGRAGGVDLAAVLADLGERGLLAVYAEGGATLAAALTRARLVDRLVVHVAGGATAAAQVAEPAPCVQPPRGAGWRWRAEGRRRLGPDLELVAVPEGEA